MKAKNRVGTVAIMEDNLGFFQEIPEALLGTTASTSASASEQHLHQHQKNIRPLSLDSLSNSERTNMSITVSIIGISAFTLLSIGGMIAAYASGREDGKAIVYAEWKSALIDSLHKSVKR